MCRPTLNTDSEFWTQLIANGDHIEKFGRFEQPTNVSMWINASQTDFCGSSKMPCTLHATHERNAAHLRSSAMEACLRLLIGLMYSTYRSQAALQLCGLSRCRRRPKCKTMHNVQRLVLLVDLIDADGVCVLCRRLRPVYGTSLLVVVLSLLSRVEYMVTLLSRNQLLTYCAISF